MKRLTVGNVLKFGTVVVFFFFISFLLLIIGIAAKSQKLIIEGAIYAALFILAVSLPMTGPFGTLVGFVMIGSMIASGVRSFTVRDLWLPARGSRKSAVLPSPVASPAPQPFTQVPQAVRTVMVPDERSAALNWVSSQAKVNQHRLPSGSYVTILETCQMLDAVVDAEKHQPSGDARFEYELDAVVKEYLPKVLQGFLSIPPAMVDRPQPNGRTPNQELQEQLKLLQRQAETLHSARHSQYSTDFSSTGNFLRERFGHHQEDGFDFGIK